MRWGVPALLIAAVFVCYSPVFHNGFVYDDHFQLERNPNIRGFGHIKELFTHDVWSFSPETNSNNYRPLHMLAYLLIHQVFGFQPVAYHVVNLLLFAANVLLFWKILLKYVDARPAFAGALLFAVHPIHVESVAWIGGMTETLCGLFILLSYLLYLRGKIWFSFTAFIFAALSKETALVFPFVIAADYALFRSKSDRPKFLAWEGAAGAFLIFYVFLRIYALGSFIRPNTTAADLSMFAPVVFAGLYVAKLILPVFLSVYYSFMIPLSWGVVVQGSVICLCILIFLFVFRNNRVFLFGWVWFVLFLAPALLLKGVSPVLFADRYVYLPSAGFLLAVVSLPLRRLLPLLIIVSVVFGVLTYSRSQVWKDDLTLWSDAVEKSPSSDTVNYNLGTALLKQKNYAQASLYFARATEVNPKIVEAYYNLAICRYRLNDFDGARRNLQLYLRYSDPKDPLRKDVEAKLQQLSK
jgi:hypothetical protein